MYAIVAQLVERIHGKDEVSGSIPLDGSREKRLGRYRSGQTELTVNQLAYAFGGSSPPRPTKTDLKILDEQKHGRV